MNGIVTTNKARCRDCYRCVRVCPVKAIRITDGQAQVDAERCLACGSCVRECPQMAKQVRSDLASVKELVASGARVAASVAPSYVAAFPEYGGGLFPSIVRELGFCLVTETAVGAEMVARQTEKLLREKSGTFVSSACPALVDLIEKYHPWAADRITPIVSPMIAHARHLKAQAEPGLKVVFIGPCPAKKREAEQYGKGDAVDAVLTFDELRRWIESLGIRTEKIRPSKMDGLTAGHAKLFPLEGGLAATAGLPLDLLRQEFAALSGSVEIEEMLANIRQGSAIRLFEGLFCPGGCINGACFGDARDIFTRKNRLLQHEKRAGDGSSDEEIRNAMEAVDFHRCSRQAVIAPADFSEAAIGEVLHKMGKQTGEDELNCGACGYASCRDNAKAVLSGMAELGMCIPWMRKVAERKADLIIDESPNGIVMVDASLNIVSFNPAFAEIFQGTPQLIGKPLSTLMDPADFELVLAKAVDRITNKNVSYPSYRIQASLNVYRLENEDMVVGILANVSKGEERAARMDKIRLETLASAEEVIKKQMTMAQEIAGILGETTSETRVLLRKLTQLMKDSEERES